MIDYNTWLYFLHVFPVKKCPQIFSPQNGRISHGKITFGARRLFVCNVGYTLLGAEVTLCQANGQWSHSQPTCSSKSCLTHTHTHSWYSKQFQLWTSSFLYHWIKLTPKTIGNRKGDLREVARSDKHYLGKSADRKAQIRDAFFQFGGAPDWFVLGDLQNFTGSIYHPEQSDAQSLFLFPIVFLFH